MPLIINISHRRWGTSVSLFLFFFLPFSQTFSQSTDSIALGKSRKYAESLYDNFFKHNNRLLVGAGYKELTNPSNGHSFFLTDDFIGGDISYGDELYRNIPLLFDLVSGEILTERPSDGSKIVLIKEKVKEFTIDNHRFVQLKSSLDLSLSHRFLEIIHQGKVSAYILWSKETKDDLSGRTVRVVITDKKKYYIEKEGVFFTVRGKNSILQIYKDQKSLMRKYMKNAKMRFGENQAMAISALTRYYNSIQSGL